MEIMGPESITRIEELFTKYWAQALSDWAKQDEVVLFYEAEKVLCQTACEWVGIPLPEDEVDQRRNLMSALIDSAGAVGPRHWRGRIARVKAENWIGRLIEDIRKGIYTLEKMFYN
ncbi:MAG TPA: hypothetical protein VGB50_00150 [Flavobacterium sp.]